jgi:hypothetical protein
MLLGGGGGCQRSPAVSTNCLHCSGHSSAAMKIASWQHSDRSMLISVCWLQRLAGTCYRVLIVCGVTLVLHRTRARPCIQFVHTKLHAWTAMRASQAQQAKWPPSVAACPLAGHPASKGGLAAARGMLEMHAGSCSRKDTRPLTGHGLLHAAGQATHSGRRRSGRLAPPAVGRQPDSWQWIWRVWRRECGALGAPQQAPSQQPLQLQHLLARCAMTRRDA